MTRNLRSLSDAAFDVLVIGGGIYGATIAWEAAHRGLSVALVDRGDFGGATSFNSLKTLHGGLRSLQRGSLREMRTFIRERRALLRIAPHLVEPLRFLVPTDRSLRNPLVMRAALAINDAIARDRNEGLDPLRHLGRSRVVSLAEAQRLLPGLDPSSATGGATWFDAQMYNPDRVVLAFVQSAAAAGAAVANHVSVDGFLATRGRVLGVSARDALARERFDVRARVTVNAAGAWAPELLAALSPAAAGRVLNRMSRAVNLVTRRPAPPCALGNVVDGRFLFCVPWRGIAMFGTLHTVHEGAADDVRVRRDEVEVFLRDVNRAFPAAGADLDDVTLVHRGLLPMDGLGRGEVRLSKNSQVRDHRAEALEGLVTVVGVRYTTARQTAEETVDTVADLLGRQAARSRSATTPLAGGEIGDVQAFLHEAARASERVPAASLDRLARSYGTGYPAVLAAMERDPASSEPLGPGCAVTRAEILYAVRHEMALRLSDAVLRRTEAGSAACPGRAAIETAAAVMASELGWDAARVANEIQDVEAVYRLAG